MCASRSFAACNRQQYLAGQIVLSVTSVTRIGEITPLWQNLKSLWQSFACLLANYSQGLAPLHSKHSFRP